MAPSVPDDAFDSFYRRNLQCVYRVCRTYMKNTSDAEDCTEDTFLRAMTKAPSFESPQHERAWLTVTAMNICKDRLKHWWRRSVISIETCTEQLQQPAPEDDGVLEAVLALPPKYKDVVYLYYYEGYQTDEIAALLRRPASTVRNQLRDARAKLKQQLGGDDL